jgi:hypothetical protein
MTPAGSDIGEYYQMLQIQSSSPDDGRKYRPKHVELTRNNKLTYIVASLCLFFVINETIKSLLLEPSSDIGLGIKNETFLLCRGYNQQQYHFFSYHKHICLPRLILL